MEKVSGYIGAITVIVVLNIVIIICFAIFVGPVVLIPFGFLYGASILGCTVNYLLSLLSCNNNKSIQSMDLSDPMEAEEAVDAVEIVETVEAVEAVETGLSQNGIALIQVDNPPAYNDVAFLSPAPSYKSQMLDQINTSPAPSYKSDMLASWSGYKSSTMLPPRPTSPTIYDM